MIMSNFRTKSRFSKPEIFFWQRVWFQENTSLLCSTAINLKKKTIELAINYGMSETHFETIHLVQDDRKIISS